MNVSSRQAERVSSGFAAYGASKGGLNALTRSIAVDYAKDGIRCNALSVGYVVNARRDAAMTSEQRRRLEARAARKGISLERELRIIIVEAARDDRATARGRAATLRRALAGRRHSDSTELIRADRDR